ncbi:MAG: vanadium-dependent haloperoxidase [Chitinophagales bacterium]|nr:vanadium-dependent haloperoxidase [Chitinophagales bacterium]
MRKSTVALVLVIALLISSNYSCKNMSSDSGSYNKISKPASDYSSKMALSWLDLLCTQVKKQRMSPLAAARSFGYYGVTMWQSIYAGVPGGKSLIGQLKDLKTLPTPDPNMIYDWPTVMNNALSIVCDEGVARYISANDKSFNDLRDKNNHALDSMLNNKDIFERSQKLGADLGNAMIDYMKGDSYDYTRENNIYESPSRANHNDYWEPTEAYGTAVEPFWGTLRPLGIDTSELCLMKPSMPYSSDMNSEFCKDCMDVYGVDTSFTEDQRIIALYWSDDAIETYTPPGHWQQIAKQQIRRNNYNLAKTAELECYLGMAQYNASIAVWKLKYKYNYLRPETYVHEVLNKPDWRPYIETPSFPEYPSGHSGFSGSSSEVLTKYFGNDVVFTDSTDMMLGLLPRKFSSFKAAANEAAMSRHYGGIHFTAGIKDGVVVGSCIADNLLKKVKLVDEPATAKK